LLALPVSVRDIDLRTIGSPPASPKSPTGFRSSEIQNSEAQDQYEREQRNPKSLLEDEGLSLLSKFFSKGDISQVDRSRFHTVCFICWFIQIRGG